MQIILNDSPKKWKRNTTILAILLILILVVTASAGVFGSNVYDPFAPPKYVQESRVQDLITLILGVPLLLFALWGLHNNKYWCLPLWTGVLAYELYVYAIYAFGAVYNVFFPLYIAAASLSIFLIIRLLGSSNYFGLQQTLGEGLPRSWIAGFFICITLIFTLIWSGSVMNSIKTHVVDSGHLIFVIDLMVVLPAFGISAYKLWQREPLGDLLAGLMLIKFFSLCVSICAGQLFRSLAHLSMETGLLSVFIPLGLISLIFLGIYFRRFRIIQTNPPAQ